MAERSVVVRLRAEVADFKRQLAEATKAVEGVGKQAQQSAATASTAMGRMVQSATVHRQEWDQAGRTLLGFGTITVTALAASAAAAVSWESAWTGVLKTVDGTDAQLQGVEDGLRGLARTLPATHGEIAAVAEAAGQLGVKTKDIVGFTKVMIDLGETTNLSAEEAATSIAQLMNVMRTSPKDVGRLGAALVALGNDGASTERDIIQMAQRISGAGKIIGLTEGEVLGLANALASVGIEVEAGGSAISRVLTDMAKAVSKGGDELEAWSRVAGMSADQFAAKWKADPAEALTAFIGGLGRMQAAGEDVFTVLDDLGQSDVRVSRALLTMATSGDLLTESLELGNQAWADNTALAEEAGKRYDTTAAKVAIARNSLNDAAISIGDTLLPALAAGAEQLAGFAQAIADLPEPVRVGIAGISGIAGVTALAAGAFLLTFPRVIETVKAFRQLNEISPSTATALGKVGKAAGVVGIALAALAIADAVKSSLQKTTASVEVTTQALLEMGTSLEDIDALFAGSSAGLLGAGKGIDSLADAIDRIIKPDAMDRFNDVWGEIRSVGKDQGGVDRDAVAKQFNAIGESLAALVSSGNADLAAEQFDALGDVWVERGGDLEDLKGLMPAYTDALAGVANQEELATGSASGLAESYNALTGATEQVTEEQAKWREELSGLDAAFVDVYGAYDTLVQKNQEAAQAAADASEDTEDSWETFISQFPETVAGYLDELQKMVDAQNDWELNMLLLSGRVSQGTLDELARMGPEGAPLVAQLVNASDEELARMEALFSERSTAATDAFATALDTSSPIIAAAAAQLGDEAAREIAAKLAAGTTTVEQIMYDYGLKIEGYSPSIDIDTTNAQIKLDRFITDNSGRRIYIDTVGRTTGVSSGAGNTIARAGGGPVYGAGTETSDSIDARLSHNEHVWSAAEVKGAGGHAAVANLRAAARMGLPPTATMRFANGGSPAWSGAGAATAPVMFPTDGWSLTGVLQVDASGYARLVDAKLSRAQDSRTSAVSRGVR